MERASGLLVSFISTNLTQTGCLMIAEWVSSEGLRRMPETTQGNESGLSWLLLPRAGAQKDEGGVSDVMTQTFLNILIDS